MNAQARAREFASHQVGLRCHWPGDEFGGVIRFVEVGHGGWPVYVVEWDEGAPEWYSSRISASRSPIVIEGARS